MVTIIRLADWLEVYGSLDSMRIYRLCNSR